MFCLRTLDIVLVGLVFAHLYFSPYTKVEESFNIQAIHDILNYGVYPKLVIENYDHMEFPGVVPRTFVGGLIIAGFVKIIDYGSILFTGSSLVTDMAHGQMHIQIIARAVLGLANVWGILCIRNSITKISTWHGQRTWAGKTGFFYTLMFLSQFHILFYATRTLPNFMALPFVNFALSKILVGDMLGLSWLAFAGVVFRLEVGIFAAIIAVVSSLIFGQSNIFSNVLTLVVSSAIGCFVSLNVDSYFWETKVLPELAAFKFNVLAGKSVEWGVEPYSAYFTKYIVNFFRPPHVLFLSLFGFALDPSAVSKPKSEKPQDTPHQYQNSLRVLAVSALLYIATMSFQPHKEWRFIIYVVPIFNALAGNGLAHLWSSGSKLFAHKLLLFFMIASTLFSFVFSSFISLASSYNYPGGQAINWVNDYVLSQNASSAPLVHMDIPACMTGVTKFTQFHDNRISYDKTENEEELAKIWNNVSILITHKNMSSPEESGLIPCDASNWEELHQISAFTSIRGLGFVRELIAIARTPKIRKSLILNVIGELTQYRFDTLNTLFRRSIVLKTYLYVYKRTADDALPETDETRKTIQYSSSTNAVELEELPVADIDPQEIKHEINKQIDELEDKVNHHIVDEL